MNRILNTTKLDFYTAKSIITFMLITYVISALVGVSAKQPIISVVLVLVFGTYIAGSVFSVEEKNHIDKLYGILPLKKSDMVAGRYIYALIIGLVNSVIGGIFGFASSLIVNAGLSSVTLLSTVSLAFLYFCFAVSIAFPVYYKFSFTKAYVFTMIPIYLVVLFGVFLARRTGFNDSVGQAFQFLSGAPVLLLLFGLIIGLIFFVISAYISVSVYKHKEVY